MLQSVCTAEAADWNWKSDESLMLWTYADTGIENIDGVGKWRDHSRKENHMTAVGSPEVKENALNGHRAMLLNSNETEYFYVDFAEKYVGSSTIFIVGNMKNHQAYKGMFSTSTPNYKKTHNTFETYLLNNNIESASMNSSSGDINKDRQFNNVGFEFNVYKNFISRYENIENNGSWSSTSLKTYYSLYDEETDRTMLDMKANFGNRAYNSEARFNTYAGFTLGSRWEFKSETPDAEFAEVIIFARALSEEEILGVSEYISEKYFKPADKSKKGVSFSDSVMWLKGNSYPADINVNGFMEIPDYSGKGNSPELISADQMPEYIENYRNSFGAYIFKGGDIARVAAAEMPAGESTVFLAADFSKSEDGNILSLGENGIGFEKSENKIYLKTGGKRETIGECGEFAVYAARVKNNGEAVSVQGYINGECRTLSEHRDGWRDNGIFTIGGTDFILAEAVVFPYALTDAEMSSVSERLVQKYSETLEVKGISYLYTDENGELCEIISGGGTVKTVFDIKNNSDENITDAKIITAVYDGRLLYSVSVSNGFTLAEGAETAIAVEKAADLPDDIRDTEIKHIFWSSFTNMIPLKQGYERIINIY